MDARIRDGARRKYRIAAVPKRAQICSDNKKNWGATKKKYETRVKMWIYIALTYLTILVEVPYMARVC